MVPFYVFLSFVLLPLPKPGVVVVAGVVVVEVNPFPDQDPQVTGAFLHDPVAPVIIHPAR